ncbi:MAG TPA: hypothetical protein VE197_18790, partial [Mycobacterium sp.]|nr:hypothetical protein [Mycobacterium sp.]
MRRATLLLLSLIAVSCAIVPATASAAAGPPPDVEAPLFPAANQHTIPRGFRIDPAQAVTIAKTSAKMQAIHRAHHPLHFNVFIWVRDHYEVYFYFHGKQIADQLVGP